MVQETMLEKKSEFYVCIHDNINGRVVSVCDTNLTGKTFEEGDLQLDVSESFYKGDIMNEEQVISLIKNEKNLNLVGENIINLCLKFEIIQKNHVLYINKIPHVQLISL